jgi:hypothetical protein
LEALGGKTENRRAAAMFLESRMPGIRIVGKCMRSAKRGIENFGFDFFCRSKRFGGCTDSKNLREVFAAAHMKS